MKIQVFTKEKKVLLAQRRDALGGFASSQRRIYYFKYISIDV